MNYAINKKVLSAIRISADQTSEMTSQLLFGEYCKIVDTKDDFYKIENCIDKHCGWVTKDSFHELNENEIKTIQEQPIIRVAEPIADTFCQTDKSIYRLPAGSLLTNYDTDTSKFELAQKTYQIHPSFITYLPDGNIDGIVPTAMSFLNTPYLAGGKTVLGIDCSGFAQLVCSINGFIIPRFSRLQSEIGETIMGISEAKAGDLFFFRKEDAPSHTAIYLGNNKIIHAQDSVTIQEVDSTGFDLPLAKYNRYELYKIKRLN